jgi:hypothetical protein
MTGLIDSEAADGVEDRQRRGMTLQQIYDIVNAEMSTDSLQQHNWHVWAWLTEELRRWSV